MNWPAAAARVRAVSSANPAFSRRVSLYRHISSRIRAGLEQACAQAGARLWLPPLSLCGDNAAMIGSQGYYEYLAGRTAGWELNARANLDISRG